MTLKIDKYENDHDESELKFYHQLKEKSNFLSLHLRRPNEADLQDNAMADYMAPNRKAKITYIYKKKYIQTRTTYH